MKKEDVVKGLNGILNDANEGFAWYDEYQFIQKSIHKHFPEIYNDLTIYDSDVPLNMKNKYDKDDILLRNVDTDEIIFHSKDIEEVMKEFKKYPLYTVSVGQLPIKLIF